MPAKKNMVGLTFGNLKVLQQPEGRKVLIRCGFCKKTRWMQRDSIRSGKTKSCGCQTRSIIAAARTSHGHNRRGKRSSEYSSWAAMVSRCTNKKCPEYKYYGGRGITVHSGWLGPGGFARFLKHIGPRPAGLWLERKNNNRGYVPGNVCWETQPKQMRNRRNCIYVTIGKRTMTVAEWCREKKQPSKQVYFRISKLGWDPVEAVTRKMGQ